jgi:WD40 repeat protein
MNHFEITIQQPLHGVWPVVAEYQVGSQSMPLRAETSLTLDFAALREQAHDARAYGETLGAALFRDGLRDAFVRAVGQSSERLRILLCVEASDLRLLRWERLCAPINGTWQPLAHSQRLPFSRYLPSLTDRRFPAIGRRDLRVLLVAADLEGLTAFGLSRFDAPATVRGLQQALGSIPADVLELPSLDALCAQLTSTPYTLLHLVAHGRVIESGETVLYLARHDDPHTVDPIPASRLIERLAGLQTAHGLPHCAFLSTCESASPDAEGALGGLAQRLVRELGMPAVVAMADKVQISTATLLANGFYSRLHEHGEVDRALVEAMAGLVEQNDSTVPVLYSRLGGRPLFSNTLDRPLTAAEIEAGLQTLSAALPERAPVLQDELAQASQQLQAHGGVAPELLAPAAREERAAALRAVGALCLEATDLDFAALCFGLPLPAYDARCPFPGLASFQTSDQAFFFGRNTLVERLAAQLTAHPFLAVLGPSGSGKSSLVRAGLVPFLQQHPITTMTPGTQPLLRLDHALTPLYGPLASGPYIDSAATDAPALLLIDQFEELFTLCADRSEREAFISRMLALPCPVIITMRADFWGECASYPALREAMTAHQQLIAPMTPEELRQVMELQAAAVGLRFEADLGGTILDHVRNEPGAMPLLQHALHELWQRRRGRWLRGEEYRAIGGIQRAIAHTADGIYRQLAPADQEALREIFIRLTRLDSEEASAAEASSQSRDTRRRVPFNDLVPGGADPALTRELVRRMADARLLVTARTPDGSETVEVAHEALIRSWPRLRDWLDGDRTALRMREGISLAVDDWDLAGEDESFLLRGSRLDEALSLLSERRLSLNAREQRYLDNSLALRERERSEHEASQRRSLRQARLLAVGASVAGVFAIIALLLFFRTRGQEIETARQIAENQRQARIVVSGDLAARAVAGIDEAPQRSLLLAIESVRTADDFGEQPIPQAREALYTLLGASGGTPLLDHNLPVAGVAFSPDGRWLISASFDTTVRVWDTANPTAPPRVLREHRFPITLTALSPDGMRFATADAQGNVLIWELATMERPLARLDGGVQLKAMAFTPDNRLLITGDISQTSALLRAWPMDGGLPTQLAQLDTRLVALAVHSQPGVVAFTQENTLAGPDTSEGESVVSLRSLPGQTEPGLPVDHKVPGRAASLSFARDGTLFAKSFVTAKSSVTNLRWPADQLAQPGQPMPGSIGFFPFASGDGDYALASAQSTTIYTTSQSQTVAFDASQATHLAYQSTDNTLFVGYDKGTIQLVDALSGNIRTTLRSDGDTQEVALRSMQLSPARTHVVAVLGNVIRLWRLDEALATPRITRPALPALALGVSSDYIAAIDEQTLALHLYSLATGTTISRSLGLSLYQPVGLAFSANQGALVTAFAGRVERWDLATLAPTTLLERPFGDNEPFTVKVALSDERYLFLGDDTPNGRLWDLQQPATPPRLIPRREGEIYVAAFNPAGTIQLWSTADPAQAPRLLRGHGPGSNIYLLAYSRDGQKLLSGGTDRSVVLWDLSGAEIKATVLGGQRDFVGAIAFSPDGSRIASAEITNGQIDAFILSVPVNNTQPSTIRLWETARLSDPPVQIALSGALNQYARGLAFRDDGRSLLFSDGLQTMQWPLELDDLVALACATASRNLTIGEWQTAFGTRQYRKTCPARLPGLDALIRGLFAAQAGDQQLALSLLELARESDPTVVPAARERQWAARGHLQVNAFAQAMDALEAAHSLQPDLVLVEEYSAVIDAGANALREGPGSTSAVYSAYERLERIDPTLVSITNWERICRKGALWGGADARAALQACDRAVALEPDNGRLRDSRGIAYAMAGQRNRAIEDFAFFVLWAQGRDEAALIGERQGWIDALRNGGNPFDPATIARIRAEP